MEADVPVRNVFTTAPEKAKALENDFRAKIVDMLADEELTIEEIHAGLQQRGEKKAETTVRHHVNILQDAGIVELARLEDAGGGTRKYYKSNTRVYSYELPDGAEETLAGALATVRADLKESIEDTLDENGDAIATVADEMKPCEYCDRQRYEEFIVRMLIDRALTDLSEEGELDDFLAE